MSTHSTTIEKFKASTHAPRVLVTVSGGVAYVQASEGVEIAMIDYDKTHIWQDGVEVEAQKDDERAAMIPERFLNLPCTELEEF